MAVKKDKSLQRGVSHAKSETPGRIVLVGTYKGDQLTDWRGWYNYPATGKAHSDKYLLFKIQFMYRHKADIPEDAERVIVRAADFAKRSPKVAMQLNFWDIPQMQVLKPSVPFPSPVHQKFTLSIEKEAA